MKSTSPDCNGSVGQDSLSLRSSGLLGQLDTDSFLHLAECLVGEVASLHSQKLLHTDIRPDTLLFEPETNKVYFSSVESASQFGGAETVCNALSMDPLRLRYAAPELTGRLDHSLDYRTDLYSVGVTLYEMATGRPPFDELDVLSLVHSHLAREPNSPQDLAPWLPTTVAQIILTLLAKDPSNRYQSAFGLLRDLRSIKERIRSNSALVNFNLRGCDIPSVPLNPSRLHGRSVELELLRSSFESLKRGIHHSIFIGGPSGVGKTSLIETVRPMVESCNGHFIHIKFVEIEQDQALNILGQGLNRFCERLLSDADLHSAVRGKRLIEGIGSDAAQLCKLIPALQSILPNEIKDRVHDQGHSARFLVERLHEFLMAMALEDSPLVLFLDDLQWADSVCLRFIERLIDTHDKSAILLLGAYRSEEIDPKGFLARILSGRSDRCEVLTHYLLPALGVEDARELIAGMLAINPQDVGVLAELVDSKARGNPYFTIEYVRGLARQGLLIPDYLNGTWNWSADQILAGSPSDSLVDYLISELSNLSETVQDTLVILALLGDSKTIQELAHVLGSEPDFVALNLAPAVSDGFLVIKKQDSVIKGNSEAVLSFCHDRMREAVYRLRDEEWKSEANLLIARRYCQSNGSEESQHFAAAHFAAAMERISQPEDIEKARNSFEFAAERAYRSTLFPLSERYVRHALALISRSTKSEDHDHVLLLKSRLHLLSHCQSFHEKADSIYEELLDEVETPQQLVNAACNQIISLSNRTRYEEAVDIAIPLLGALGTLVPTSDLMAEVNQELDFIYRTHLESLHPVLPAYPARPDVQSEAVAKIMNRVIPAAFFCRPLLAFWLVVRILRSWVNEGFRPSYLYPTVCFMLASIGLRGDFQAGYRLGREALDVGTREQAGIELSRAQHIFGLLCIHWQEPLHKALDYSNLAYEGLMRGAELEFACFTFYTSLSVRLEAGEDLMELEAECQRATTFSRKYGNRHAEASFLSFRQFVRCLRGQTAGPGLFDDDEFDAEDHVLEIAGNAMAQAFYHALRAMAAAVFNQREMLLFHAQEAYSLKQYITGFYFFALVHTLFVYARLRELSGIEGTARNRILGEVASDLRWVSLRAKDSPTNFAYLSDWLEGEYQASRGNTLVALQAFEGAISAARENQRNLNHALISESASRFYFHQGLDTSGRGLLTRAYEAYSSFGADAKVASLRQEWSYLGVNVPKSQTSLTAHQLDYQALISASQALSAERSIPQLVDKLVSLIARMTGATDVRLTSCDDHGNWYLEGGIRGEKRLQKMRVEEAGRLGIVSMEGFRRGLSLSEPLILHNALSDAVLNEDPHFKGLGVCSMLALPIRLHGKTIAFLVLENRLMSGAFTRLHLDALMFLCSQLAVSLQNIRINEALEESERRFRRIVENLPIAYQSLDIQGHWIDANEKLAHLLGFENPEDMIGLNFGDFWQDEVAHKFQGTFGELVETGSIGADLILRRLDGGEVTAQIVGCIQRDPHGLFQCTHCVLIDVSERKTLERQIVAINQSLEEKVKRRTRELETATQAKQHFLAMVSHELKTPLNAIIGLAQILSGAERDHEIADQIRRIGAAGETLNSIISDILDFSKIEAGQLKLEMKPFPLRQVLSHLYDLMHVQATAKGLILSIEASGKVPRDVIGDSMRLQQILMNLISNAIKFTNQGEITVRVTVKERRQLGDCLHFEVRDTGIGIAEDVREKLFQPFIQADASVNRRYGGAGLGLSICKRLVDLMDGTIGAESTLGIGSRFWFDIPKKECEFPLLVPFSPHEGLRNDCPLSGLRLMVVDDDESNRIVSKEILQKLGAVVTALADGQKAYQTLEKHPQAFDAVLMDLQMPEMDGFAVTRAIRKHPLLFRLPVIALTAGFSVTQEPLLEQAGINGVVLKPLDVDHLTQVLLDCTRSTLKNWNQKSRVDEVTVDSFSNGSVADERSSSSPYWYQDAIIRFEKNYRDTTRVLGVLNNEEALQIIHKLVGSSGMLGFQEVMKAAESIEVALLQQKDIRSLLPALDEALARVLPEPSPEPNIAESEFASRDRFGG